jgi:hypothetical protein
MKTDFRIDGLAELEKALKDLRQEMTQRGQAGKEGKLVPNALRWVARNNILPRMKRNAPISASGSNIDWHYSANGKWVHGGPNGKKADKGRLRRSIFYKPERNPRYLNEVFYIGPRAGEDRNDPEGAWYAAIVEFQGGAGGAGRGFMRKSINPEADTKAYAYRLGVGIERVAKKIGNQNLAAVGSAAKKRFKP